MNRFYRTIISLFVISISAYGMGNWQEQHDRAEGQTADLIPQFHRMPVIIVQAGTYYGDGSGTPEVQKEFAEQVIQRLEATADAKGRGITCCDHKVYRQQ